MNYSKKKYDIYIFNTYQDIDIEKNNKFQKIIIWNESCNPEKLRTTNVVSVNKIIEENYSFYRNKFLKFLDQFSGIINQNSFFLNKFNFDENINLWWSSPIFERSNIYKSFYIDEIIRLSALIDYLEKYSIKGIYIKNENYDLVNSLDSYIKNKKILLYWKIKFHMKLLYKTRKLVTCNKLVKILMTIIYIGREIYFYIRFYDPQYKEWVDFKSKNIFVTYLSKANLENTFLNPNETNYWGSLPRKLKSEKINSKWIHIPINVGINISEYVKTIKSINQNNKNTSLHKTIYGFVNLNIFIRAIIIWSKMSFKNFADKELNLKNIEIRFNLIHFLKSDINDSLLGKSLFKSIFYLLLFKRAFKSLDKKSRCFYLCENQFWESCLNNSWKSFNLGNTYGVLHTVIKEWDLRYFNKYDYSRKFKSLSFSQPNCYLVNSNYSFEKFSSYLLPDQEIFLVDALRFEYLNNIEKNNLNSRSGSKLKLLVITDYIYEYSIDQLEIINNSKYLMNSNFEIKIKFHPAGEINNFDFKLPNISISKEPISDLLKKCDLAFVCANSVTAIEALTYEIKTIFYKYPYSLDYSVVKGIKNLKNIYNLEQFDMALKFYLDNQFNEIKFTRKFYFNKLDAWIKLMQK